MTSANPATRAAHSAGPGRPIYIDGRFYGQHISGVQRYSREIVAAIDRLLLDGDIGGRWVLLLPRGLSAPPLRAVEVRTVGPLRGHPWSQVTFPLAARDGVALSLSASGAVLHPRHLVVIHDVSVFRHPEYYSKVYGFTHRTFGRLLSRTAKLATVSEFSRAELSQVLRVPPGKILVAPNGSEHLSAEVDEGVRARLGLDGVPYFLTIGNLNKNKNLAVVLRAIDRLDPDANPVRLVAVGRLDAAVFGAAGLKPSPALMLAGRLDDPEVAGLMRHARALIFPSIYEGAGIPPMEAMTNGCPVLASTAPAVMEISGDAAEYFDPHDDEKLADLMRNVLADDGSWHARQVAKGRVRAAHYSWRDSARTLADACLKLARPAAAVA